MMGDEAKQAQMRPLMFQPKGQQDLDTILMV
jgi:hypothetical protein